MICNSCAFAYTRVSYYFQCCSCLLAMCCVVEKKTTLNSKSVILLRLVATLKICMYVVEKFLVYCNLTSQFKLRGVNSTSYGNIDGRYYVNDTYTYQCNFGYEKAVMDIIQCGTDGKWTISPNCTERGRSACASCCLISTSISAT